MSEKEKILDIAMNLNRIGNWAADDYQGKYPRIKLFITQTSDYIKLLNYSSYPPILKKTFKIFLSQFNYLITQSNLNKDNSLIWAEKMMTWGNILTHRVQLLN